MTAFVPQDSIVKKNLPLWRISTCTSMINDKKLSFPFLLQETCCGYLWEWPQWGNSNKYPQHMFLGVLNIIFLNISNYLPHLELRNRSIQIVVKPNFVIVASTACEPMGRERSELDSRGSDLYTTAYMFQLT